MNSRFRCAGCREFRPVIERRRIGNVGVCGDACAQLVLTKRPLRKTGSPSSPGRPGGRSSGPSEIPTAVRAAVVARDRGRCRFCGVNRAGHLHHIRYRSEGVDHQEHNLLSLCPACHDRAHSDKNRWKPLLLGVIWLQYVHGRRVTVAQLERILAR